MGKKLKLNRQGKSFLPERLETLTNPDAILAYIDRFVSNAKHLPWKAYLWLVAGTFTLASILSSVAGELIMPDVAASFRQPANLANGVTFRPETASLDALAIQNIVERNIFNIEGKTGEEEPETDNKEAQPKGNEAIKTTLPLKLLGTIYGGDPLTGIAMIEDTSKRVTNSFFAGDLLASDAKVAEIYREKIFIDRGTYREYLELERPPEAPRRRMRSGGPAPTAALSPKFANEPPPETYKEEGFERQGSNIVVSSDFRKKLLTSDFAKVLQDAKAEPVLVNGELHGFRLTRIREDSIYQKAGLQNGDVVKEINGVSLVDTAQAIKLLNSLRGENEIDMRLDRGGKNMSINMQVR